MQEKQQEIWSALQEKNGWQNIRQLFGREFGPLEENERAEILDVLKLKRPALHSYLQDRCLPRPCDNEWQRQCVRAHLQETPLPELPLIEILLENLRACGFKTKPIMSTKRVDNPSLGGQLAYDLVTTNEPLTNTALYALLDAIDNTTILTFDQAVHYVFAANELAIVSDKTLFHGKSTESYTLLHLAVERLQVNVVKVLLDPEKAKFEYEQLNGSNIVTTNEVLKYDVNCKNDADRTPLDIIIDRLYSIRSEDGILEIINTLLQTGATQTPLHHTRIQEAKNELNSNKRSITHDPYYGTQIKGGEDRFASLIRLFDTLLEMLPAPKPEQNLSERQPTNAQPTVETEKRGDDQEIALQQRIVQTPQQPEEPAQPHVPTCAPALWKPHVTMLGCVAAFAILCIAKPDMVKSAFSNLKDIVSKYCNDAVESLGNWKAR